MRYALALTAVLLVGFAGTFARGAEETFADISHKDLLAAIQEKKVVLLDCNGTEKFKTGHIPGALDFAAIKKDLAAKLPADKGALVVAYCGSEKCGAYKAGATAAKELGYTNVKHYAPGIAGWKASGEKTENEG